MQQNIQWYTCTKVFFPLKKNLIVIAGVHSKRKKNRGVYRTKVYGHTWCEATFTDYAVVTLKKQQSCRGNKTKSIATTQHYIACLKRFW